ncbi:leucine-rich repeat-containing protein 74B-like isoform X2 [Physella acuta]|uniref:leucine-rich repeat-containing protein 74B-like isoform X2 n=1 Tax=Physella acuta TaxID=109671 RepID=UPI0027DCCC98|nr:leucine-rich repeat-containing protein 74B-like isoform X2 [Physella acuta]
MASFFDPVSVAIETLKTIEGVGCHKPDPIRFKIQLPEDPGKWAKISSFKRGHNINKWSIRFQKKLGRSTLGSDKQRRRLSSSVSLPVVLQVKETEPDVVEVTEPVPDEVAPEEAPKPVSDRESLEKSAEAYDAMFFGDDRTGEEEDEEIKKLSGLDREQMRYFKACQKLKCIPSRRIMRSIGTFEIELATLKLNDLEFKAFMVALIANDEVQRLDLTEAICSEVQMAYLTDVFSEDTRVTDLILADNFLTSKYMDRFFETMTQSDCLVYLDISGNNLNDRDAPILCEYVKDSSNLSYLYMSRNKFTAASGDAFGKMIAVNTSLVDLDISRNGIRVDGAEKFIKGLARNSCLERLDFSWNGLGKPGIKALIAMLKKNRSLIFINLSGNRLNGKDMEKILPALKKNTTLERLVIEHNCLIMSDVTFILSEIYKLKTTGLKRIDLGSYQLVEPSIAPLIDLLFWEKNIDVRYGSTMSHSDDKQKNEDVISRFRERTSNRKVSWTR